jgi:hypothetical protein
VGEGKGDHYSSQLAGWPGSTAWFRVPLCLFMFLFLFSIGDIDSCLL